AGVQLANYWIVRARFNLTSGGWDPTALRGGSALRTDPNAFAQLRVRSDSRKPVWLDGFANGVRNWIADSTQLSLGVTATIQARSNIDLSISPQLNERVDPMQYVAQAADAGGIDHYVL